MVRCLVRVVGSVVGWVVSRFGVLTCRLCVWWVLVISGLCVLPGWCFCVGLCNIDSNAFGLVVGFAWLGFCWWCLVFVMCVGLWVAV